MKGKVAALVLCYGLILCGIGAPNEPVAAGGAPAVADGKPVFVKYKCGSCHSIEAQGIKKKAVAGEAAESSSEAPDLSGVGVERKADWIAAFLLKKEKLDDKLHIKKFRGTEAELKKLSAWLASLNDEAAAKKMKAVEGKNAADKAPPPEEKSETKSDK